MARQLPRIYLDLDLDGPNVRLSADASHYLRHVLRLGPGSSVVVFDGRGTERIAAVTSLTKRESALALGESLPPLPESPADITLVQGLIKGDGMDTIVQKATELGVTRVVGVKSQFSVVKLDRERALRRIEHWRRVAHSACEQSQRHYPPVIELRQSLAEAIDTLPAGTIALALHNHSERSIDTVDPAGSTIAMIVGPEGGLSPAEAAWLDARRCRLVRLGPRILRAETAAIVACSTAQLLWGDFR